MSEAKGNLTLSFVKVTGKAIIWYDLNYIKLYKNTGDLLFDYDDETGEEVSAGPRCAMGAIRGEKTYEALTAILERSSKAIEVKDD